MLPEKLTLFEASSKSEISLEIFFNENSEAPRCNDLKKISDVLSKLDHRNNLKEESKTFTLTMALHMEEINTQCRHLFHNQVLFRLSHNDLENLANHVLVASSTALTGEKKETHLCSKPIST